MLLTSLKQFCDSVRTGKQPARRRARLRRACAGRACAADVLESRLLLAATLWVDPAHAGNYTSISSAVAAAVPGDTIKVVPGIYNESVTIPSSLTNLTILGGQAQFAGQKGASIVESDGIAIAIEANDVTIKGFTAEPATSAGVQNADGIEIASGASGDSILNNTVVDEDEGIVAYDVANVTGDVISGNTVEGSIYGIFVFGTGSGNVTISGNTVDDNGQNTQGGGITVVTNGSALISGNTANHNYSAAITVADGIAANVVGNTADDTGGIDGLAGGGTGIIVDDGAGSASVADNTTNGNEDGVSVDTTTALVTGNTANNNSGFGFGIVTAASSTTTANTAKGNGDGLFVDSATATVDGNTASNNIAGASVYTTGQATVLDNTTNKNVFGLEVSSGSETVTGNTANSNSRIGIYVDGGPGTVSNNTANSNLGSPAEGGAGLEIIGSVTTVTNNTANNNQADGVLLDNLNGATVSDNTAKDNGDNGIDVSNSNDNTLSGNTANGNLNDGIVAENGSSGNVITMNTAVKNVTYDLADTSTGGTGTAGTLNTWTDNTAHTANPAGLL
jgi:parallel beta-helix repeat protein